MVLFPIFFKGFSLGIYQVHVFLFSFFSKSFLWLFFLSFLENSVQYLTPTHRYSVGYIWLVDKIKINNTPLLTWGKIYKKKMKNIYRTRNMAGPSSTKGTPCNARAVYKICIFFYRYRLCDLGAHSSSAEIIPSFHRKTFLKRQKHCKIKTKLR